MGSILKTVLKYFFEILLTPLFSYLGEKFREALAERRAQKEARKTSEEAREKMEQAKTKEEIDEAADDTLNGV